MKRGTTPTHTFTLPFDTSLLSVVRVTYAQMGRVVLTKTGEELTLEGNTVTVRLSQEETFRFNSSHPVELQVRALTADGDAINSDIVTVPVGRCLDKEVIV